MYKIRAGSVLWSTENGRDPARRHKFSADAQAKVTVHPRYFTTILVVKSGPDRGKYFLSV